jgi:HlyD family secretion protein
MKNKFLWITIIIIIALLGGGYLFRDNLLPLIGQPQVTGQANAQGRPGQADGDAAPPTTTIRPAAGSNTVSAAGNIEVVRERPVIWLVEGTVTDITVEVGDTVTAGDLLVSLDSTELTRALKQAELDLQSAQLQLDNLYADPDLGEVASAQASLASAQENLLDVQAGPSQAELAAAESSLAAAQNRYQELLAGPSQAELIQLKASLEKAEITLAQAQAAYNRIAYSDSIGASSQAADLQTATIDYESAKAAFDEANAPATQSELQDALSTIQSAQSQLETLRGQPTAADLAAADAQVASAAAQLEALLAGPTDSEVREAQINVEQAQLGLEEAQANLTKAQLVSPIDGTILSIDLSAGQQVSSGTSALTMADLTQLKLTINVAEVDISKIQIDQPVQITIDALPEKVFRGAVAKIAPASDSEQGVVNYPVTVHLDGSELGGIRPGMTAVATILDDDSTNSWLVPTSAVVERNGNTAVLIIRDGQPQPVRVTKTGTQGDWTVVESAELQAGDEAVGTVSSFLNQDDQNTFRGGFGPGFGPPPGGGARPGGGQGGGGGR